MWRYKINLYLLYCVIKYGLELLHLESMEMVIWCPCSRIHGVPDITYWQRICHVIVADSENGNRTFGQMGAVKWSS
jgi:hypothetical protein